MKFTEYISKLKDSEKHSAYLPLKKFTIFITRNSLEINRESFLQYVNKDGLDKTETKIIKKYVEYVEIETQGNSPDSSNDAKVSLSSHFYASDKLSLSEIEEKQENIQIYNDVKKYAMSSRSENTIEGYKKDFKQFHNFCVRKNMNSLPATPDTVIAYITWRANNGKAATIKRHLSAIQFVHKNSNYPSPVTNEVKNILDGIRRTIGDRSESKKPLLASHIQKICKCLSPTDKTDIRDKALLLINYSGCFRRSELVSLNVEDVHLVEGKGIEITLRSSKTDQYGRGTIKVIPYGENEETCPVLALRHWLISAGIVDGAIFRGFDINNNLMNDRLTDRSVPNIIKRLVELIGLNPAEYSGHSTRSGAATQAGLNKSSLKQIMELGDWKSANTAMRYQRSINKFDEKADLGL